MIVLHALYSPADLEKFIFFGENGNPESTTYLDSNPNNPIDHPFASDYDNLYELLFPITDESVRFHDPLIIELPTKDSTITGSVEWEKISGCNHTIPDSFILCTIPTVSISFSSILSFIQSIPEMKDHFVMGETIQFWKTVYEIALEMVSRGRYLPSTGRYRNGGTCIKWIPIPSSYDNDRIDLLVQAMPQVQYQYLRVSGKTKSVNRKNAIMLFLEQMIQNIVAKSDLCAPDLGLEFSPLEQLRYSEELTALYFLKGIERHKMPVKHPQISNGWKDRFMRWAELKSQDIPDDQPWVICAKPSVLDSESDIQPNNLGPEPWALSFYIQSADDSNLLISAKQCGTQKNLPDVALPQVQTLENELKKYIDIIIERSPNLIIKQRGPFDPVVLIPENDIIRFLTYDAPYLEENGLEFLYPEWWGGPVHTMNFGLAVRQMEEMDAPSVVGLHTLLNFDYRISIGDDLVDPDEFRRMVEQKTSIVKAGKRWVTVDSDQLYNLVGQTEKKFKRNSLTIADFLRLYARGESSDAEMKVFADDDWTSNLISFIRDGWKKEPIKTPSSFCGELRHYQESGLSFLVTCRSIGFGSCLADDMGLGKTPQTIAYLLTIKEQGNLQGPSLLICPTSIIGNWERELSRFGPDITYYVHHGASREKGTTFSTLCASYDLIITSYALIHRDIGLLSEVQWDVIIFDEVQNIKNTHTKQFQGAKILSSIHRIALTGTPVENHLSELWAIMDILNPGFLGSLRSFQKVYATPIEKGGATDKAVELRRLIQPFLLRRVKTDTSVISDLPEKMEMPVYCSLTHEQAALYQATINNLAIELRTATGIARKGRVLAALTRLKLICNHPSLATGAKTLEPEKSGKVKRLIEMLEEVRDEGDAAIIFTQYATFANLLAAQIKTELQKEVLLLTGSTPRLKREEMIERYMRPDGPQFFVISLRAGGTGLNLMRATHVFHIDRWWNPAVEDQATDRTYRIGQTRTVQVHLMIASGTLEEQIDEMIHRKRIVADQVIAAGENWLTELPVGELMDILRLRESVFGDDIE